MKQEFAEIDFSRDIFNDVFYELLVDESRHMALKGGAGSGKSWFVIQRHIIRMLTEDGHRFLFVRKVSNTIRNSMFRLFQDAVKKYGLEQFFTYRETDMYIRCKLTGSEVICVGVDDREKLKSIAEITGIWVEEVTELSRRDYQQLNMRLRGFRKYYKQSIYTFNPIDEDHWIHKELFPLAVDELLEKKAIVRWTKTVKIQDNGKEVNVPITHTVCHSTYENNKFLDYDEKAILEDLKEKDYKYWLVYAKGMWGRVGNLVFSPTWKVKDFPEEFDEVIYGMDFGFHHPTGIVKCGIRDGVVYLEEKLYVKKQTKSEIIETMQTENIIEDKYDIIYGDSAEPSTILDIAKAGFNILPSTKGNNSIKDSIDYLKSLEIYVHKDSVNLQRELRQFKWAQDKDENPIEGKVVPYNDDLIACVRYALYSHSRKAHVKVGFIK